MKIAICLSGQLRTFKTTYPGIVRYFDSLNTDYFIHTWSANTWHKTNKEKVIPHIHTQIDKSDIDLAIELFNPKKYQIDKNKIFDVDVSQSQQYSALMCNNIKKKYEDENNFKYDIVVKCRFDLLWPVNKIFETKNFQKNTVYFSYIERTKFPEFPMAMDKMYYGDSNTMDKISEIYYFTENLFSKGIKTKIIEPEPALYKFCNDLQIEIIERYNHEIIVRKQAEGLNHITDFEKIKQIHLDFFNMKKPDKLI